MRAEKKHFGGWTFEYSPSLEAAGFKPFSLTYKDGIIGAPLSRNNMKQLAAFVRSCKKPIAGKKGRKR